MKIRFYNVQGVWPDAEKHEVELQLDMEDLFFTLDGLKASLIADYLCTRMKRRIDCKSITMGDYERWKKGGAV